MQHTLIGNKSGTYLQFKGLARWRCTFPELNEFRLVFAAHIIRHHEEVLHSVKRTDDMIGTPMDECNSIARRYAHELIIKWAHPTLPVIRLKCLSRKAFCVAYSKGDFAKALTCIRQ